MPSPKQIRRIVPPAVNVENAYDPEMKTFSFQVGNIGAHDANFIAEVIGFFCDPLNENLLNLIKQGQLSIAYQGGHAVPVSFFQRN
jgi:hypothetical protein